MIFVFEGSAVDQWLSGLTFEATIPDADAKGITIKVQDGPLKNDFEHGGCGYDNVMWTEWCRRFAYRHWARTKKEQERKTRKRTKSRVKPDVVAKRKQVK